MASVRPATTSSQWAVTWNLVASRDLRLGAGPGAPQGPAGEPGPTSLLSSSCWGHGGGAEVGAGHSGRTGREEASLKSRRPRWRAPAPATRQPTGTGWPQIIPEPRRRLFTSLSRPGDLEGRAGQGPQIPAHVLKAPGS